MNCELCNANPCTCIKQPKKVDWWLGDDFGIFLNWWLEHYRDDFERNDIDPAKRVIDVVIKPWHYTTDYEMFKVNYPLADEWLS